MTMEHAHDEYCDNRSSVELVLLHRKAPYVILFDVTQTLMCFDYSSGVYMRFIH
jgi:hypothetical protein